MYTSTTTPLLANGVFTTGTLRPGDDDSIVGSVFSDVAGTIFIEQSPDNGNNWDISTSYPITAGNGKGINEPVLLPYVRIRYVNGVTNQTAFRLYIHSASAGAR